MENSTLFINTVYNILFIIIY